MIPKIIHYCWLSKDSYPADVKRCISSWKENLPDYEIILWDTIRFDINSVRWVEEAFSKKKYAFAADYIRFYALYNFGGIYLDSDVEVLRSFDDLLNCQSFVGFEYSGLLEAAVIGAEKHCNWAKECLSWYDNRAFFDENGKTKEIVLPIVMSSIYEKIFNCQLLDKNMIKNFNGNYLYPYHYFSPKNYYRDTIEIKNTTYTIHHFATAWLNKNYIVQIKKIIHVFMIKIFGKSFHDLILYKIRKMKNSS